MADQLRGSLEDHRVFEDHQRVVFLSHSMGGLIVRQFLLTKRDRLAKVPMLYFYATPTNGSEITKVASELSTNPQLRGMLPLEGNDLLQSIQSNAYETLPTYGIFVVSKPSATALCNQDLDPITADHIEIVKPKDRFDPRYMCFASAMRTSAMQRPEGTSILHSTPEKATNLKREGESLMRQGKYDAACGKFKSALASHGLNAALEMQLQTSLADCQARLAMQGK